MDNKTKIEKLEKKIKDFKYEQDGNRRNIEKREQHIKWIDDKIAELEKQIEELKKEDVVWKPKNGGRYYYIMSLGGIIDGTWSEMDNKDYYDIGNCFKTREEAEKAVRHLKTRAKLQRIADRLNNVEKIDWNDNKQAKYLLFYNNNYNEIGIYAKFSVKIQGAIYCLDENFADVAIKEIGEEELISYLKGE